MTPAPIQPWHALRRWLSRLLWLPLTTATLAQTPAAAPASLPTTSTAVATATAPAPPWQAIEATFQTELKKIHVPILSAYVNNLHRLAAQSRSSEATVAIENELRFVQSVIGAGGVIDLTQAATAFNAEVPSPASATAPRKPFGTLIALSPALAKQILPAPADTTAEALPFQSVTWTIEGLPKGSYELVAQCSVTALDGPSALQVTLDKQLIEFPLLKRHVTASPNDYRLLRLGRIDLPYDIHDTPLQLNLIPNTAGPQIALRQLLITRALPTPSLPSSSPSPSPSPPSP